MIEPVFVGVELGGTKLSLVLGHGREILARERLPTLTPAETLPAAAAVLARWRASHAPVALGIASFGPIAIDRSDPDFGRMLATPKPGWAGVDVVDGLAEGFEGRVALHTDVTAAALAEGAWGVATGLRDYVYVTIGTGIGVGVVVNGLPVTGLMHPEVGHLRVRRVSGDTFQGACPFHGDCLEGLASGPAIRARTGKTGEELSSSDPAWGLAADALAEAFANMFLTLATARIIVGGGVGVGQPQLLPLVRSRVVEILGGYLPFVDATAVSERVVPAALGDDAGTLGSLVLAQKSAQAR